MRIMFKDPESRVSIAEVNTVQAVHAKHIITGEVAYGLRIEFAGKMYEDMFVYTDTADGVIYSMGRESYTDLTYYTFEYASAFTFMSEVLYKC